jgi:hypothetical protein
MATNSVHTTAPPLLIVIDDAPVSTPRTVMCEVPLDTPASLVTSRPGSVTIGASQCSPDGMVTVIVTRRARPMQISAGFCEPSKW